jgi:hypothetical protein
MPTPTIAAIDNLKQALAIAEHIQELETELRSVLNGSTAAPAPSAPISSPAKKRGGKRKMSPATIAKMRASQQARWAKKRGATLGVVSPLDTLNEAPKGKAAKPAKRKSKLSPEGRARIVAALKARHAAKRAAK